MKFGRTAVFVAVVTATAAACRKPAPAPPPRVEMPADVIAIATVTALDESLSELVDYVDTVRPGEGTVLRARFDADVAGKINREGADWTKPMHLVLLTPAPGSDEPAMVWVTSVRDPDKLAMLKKDEIDVRVDRGRAVIGKPEAIDRTWSWATTSLAADAPADAPAGPWALAVFPSTIAARWNQELRAELEPGDSPGKALVRDAVLGALEQTARVDARTDIVDGTLTIDLALAPRPGTALANLLAAQKPARFDVFEQLPLDTALGTMAGSLSFGAHGERIRTMITAAMRSKLGEFGPGSAALFETIWNLSTGEYGGVTTNGATSTVNAISISDPATAMGQIDQMMKAIGTIKLPAGVRVEFGSLTHDGVAMGIAALTSDGEPAPIGLSWAAWDGRLALGMPDPDGVLLRAAIDQSRRKPSVPPALAKVIADARARGDFLLQSFDLLPGEQPPFWITAGVRDGALHLAAVLPDEQIAAIVRASQAGN